MILRLMNRLPKKRSLSSITIFSIMPPGFAVSVNEDQERLPAFYWLPELHKNHIRLDLLLILTHARLPNYQNY